MALTETQHHAIGVEIARETLSIHTRRPGTDGNPDDCRWCAMLAWPCPRAAWALGVIDGEPEMPR